MPTKPLFKVGSRVFYIGTKGVVVAVVERNGYITYDVELATGERVNARSYDLMLHT